MKQGIFEQEIFIRSNAATVIGTIADYSQHHKIHPLTVHTEAYQSPGTYITNITKVTPQDNGVRLHETITMKAPALLFGYAFVQAQTAYEEMLKRIKKFVENK